MEILYTEIIEPSGWWVGLFLIMFVLGLSIVFASIEKQSAIGMIVGLCFLAIGVGSFYQIIQPHTLQHEALIDDMNVVFDEGYAIIDRRGEIYTIEKEYIEEVDEVR